MISSGYYSTPESLVPYLNKRKDRVEFQYNKISNRFSMTLKSFSYTVKFVGGLEHILGFRQRKFTIAPGGKADFIAKYPPSMFAGSHTFFIYCSICADMDVANVKVPLLRTVAIKTKANFGDVVSVNYKSPIYVPVNTNYINSILIDIRNDMGKRIHFTEGKTQLVLHFRRLLSND